MIAAVHIRAEIARNLNGGDETRICTSLAPASRKRLTIPGTGCAADDGIIYHNHAFIFDIFPNNIQFDSYGILRISWLG